MKGESNKHHFVPRSLLRYFSVDGLGHRVHVFDKHGGKAFTPSIENAGSKNGFNKVETATGRWNFEHLFNEVDAQLHELLREIHASRSVANLPSELRRRWADIVAVQLIRTPLVRSTIIQAVRDLSDSMVNGGWIDALTMPTENDSRFTAVELFLQRDSFSAALGDKDYVLFEPAGSARFLISDHPIVQQSLAPYGGSGLQSRGVAVYLPLGPDLLLGMMCKTTAVSLNARPIEHLDIEPSASQALIALREGLRTGNPIGCPDEFVNYMNGCQVANCARFLYSHQDDFSSVCALLEQHPALKEVATLIEVGRVGEGLPVMRRMPEGQWLVLYGVRSHYMIRISDCSLESDPIDASTDQVDALERALADSPFSEMQIVKDGRPMCMMRDVRVDVLAKGRSVRFRIRPADSSMESLSEAIARHPLREQPRNES